MQIFDVDLIVRNTKLIHSNELIVDNFAGGGGASTGNLQIINILHNQITY